MIRKKYSDGRMFELDGVSVEYKDWWFNVRASNTEPLMRLIVEAKDLKTMEAGATSFSSLSEMNYFRRNRK